jgi:hypothetical protein
MFAHPGLLSPDIAEISHGSIRTTNTTFPFTLACWL